MGGARTGKGWVDRFLGLADKPTVPEPPGVPERPHFEVAGWKIYAVTALCANEDNDGGDGTLVTPTGQAFPLNWDVTSDRAATAYLEHGLVQIYVPGPVRTWDDLERQIAPLIPVLAQCAK